ncbi:uncharacterized protein C3orf38 homolog [Aplysia californica]|uniref:Uncharacterized protein C3orf38 homolog n=1 Tax=Aplysia californica TaxID=6500 RepID=A0ABM0JIN7_APLCA|nr:uncharacterized protein C3orf38 homolog [Aplysia californica]
MLTDTEKAHCKEILQLLDSKDLFSLLETATNRTIHAGTCAEAIEAIVAFTDSAEIFLKRKKINKDLLLRYTHRKKLPFSSSWSKEQVISNLLSHWEKEAASNNKKNSPVTSRCSRPEKSGYQATKSSARPSNDSHQKATFSVVLSVSSASSNIHSNIRQADSESPQRSCLIVPKTLVQNHIVNVNVNYISPSNGSGAATAAAHDGECATAVKFVTWFYNMLNSLNPSFHLVPQDFGPQHFWDNAELHLHMARFATSQTEDHAGCESVAKRLAAFTNTDMLLFHPNLSGDGVQIKSDPHGLKLILACGSLHRSNSCIGIFVQSFGIVKDPRLPDAWKVKVSYLKMQEGSMQNLPKLQDTEDCAAIEGLTVKALEGAL